MSEGLDSQGTVVESESETRISVVIPVHNRPILAVEAIRSALQQTFQPIEIVVVDDASEPEFLYSSKPETSIPVEIVRLTTNVGAAAARNVGAKHATGTHIAFLDSDDLWAASHLALLAKALAKYPKPVGAYSLCRGKLPLPRGLLQLRRIHARRLHWPSPSWKTPATLVCCKTFEQLDGFEESLNFREDTDLFLRLRECGSIARTWRVSVMIRKQPSGLSAAGDQDLDRLRRDYERVVRRQLKRADQRGTARPQRARRIWREFHRYWMIRWIVARKLGRAREEYYKMRICRNL